MKDWRKIKHLYLRAGFGLSNEEFETKKNSSLKKEIQSILKIDKPNFKSSIPIQFKAIQKKMINLKGNRIAFRQEKLKARELTHIVCLDWMKRMTSSPDPLLEKMTLFWHGHFACNSDLPHLATIQLNTLRKHALGNFRDLVSSISQDPSMIMYLNGQQNTAKEPNENFARELMELFTIGIGNYTELDVKEAGRAFTGWKVNQIEGSTSIESNRHDSSLKKFMGKAGNFDGEAIIDIILEDRQTAVFIAQKVYRYFVNHQLNSSHVQQIADIFFDSGYDISKMMDFIFQSDWFYYDINIGSKIKSPIELIVGLMKILEIEVIKPKTIVMIQRGLGQRLFYPPNVAGWPGDKAWIDNSTLMTRLNLTSVFLLARNVQVKGWTRNNTKKKMVTPTKKANVQYFMQRYASKSKEETAKELVENLLQAPLSIDLKLLYLKLKGSNKKEEIAGMLIRVLSLPEYQLC